MSIYIILRPIIALTVWVAVGLMIIPEARRAGRSWLLWYLLSMLLFIGVTAIAFGLLGVAVHPIAEATSASPTGVTLMYAGGAVLALGAAFMTVLRIKKYLRSNPKNA